MAIIETTTYECDLCGRRSINSDFRDGTENGCLHLKYTGHRGQDCGGINIKEEKLLCFECSDKVVKAIAELKRK